MSLELELNRQQRDNNTVSTVLFNAYYRIHLVLKQFWQKTLKLDMTPVIVDFYYSVCSVQYIQRRLETHVTHRSLPSGRG